jgi:hypothetical protein
MPFLFLASLVSNILVRTLRQDITGYVALQSSLEEGEKEEAHSWRELHGDVFRPPEHHPMFIGVLVGYGAQIGTAAIITALLATLGVYNPVYKGETFTALLVLYRYVLSGFVAGYISSPREILSFGGLEEDRSVDAATVPGVLHVFFLVLQIFLRSTAVPMGVSILTVFALFMMRLFVNLPLVLLGRAGLVIPRKRFTFLSKPTMWPVPSQSLPTI